MTSPLDLLTKTDDRQPSFLWDKWNPLMLAVGGFSMACFVNWASRKPTFSGIQRHFMYATIGGVAGYYIDQKRNDYLAERDAVLRHYVELHPEDFPTIERKKWGDVLEPWVPIR